MFNLLRYFSLASAIAVLAIALVMQSVYRSHAVDELIAITERQNVVLTQAFANTLWPRYAPYVKDVPVTDGDALRARPETAEIHTELEKLTAGLPVLKVKIYNLEGLTLYSSDPSQIGNDKSRNTGYLAAALDGNPASKMSFRDTFRTFSKTVYDRDVVETYIPVRGADGKIEGVFEMYTDVTLRAAAIEKSATLFTAGALGAFALLYAILFLIVHRADRILKRQYLALRDSEDRIRRKNTALEQEIVEREYAEAALQEIRQSLEQRVEERTAQLQANERSLRKARDEAEAANRAKSEFLAAMSHELRTPLNAIIGFSDIIKNETFGPIGSTKYFDYTSDINASGLHLLELINDILDLSKVESGTATLEIETVGIPTLVRSIASLVSQRAEEKEIAFTIDVPENLPEIVADERKLKQIFLNLLSNAVKFTDPGGGVTFSARCEADQGHVFRIADTGIGMASEDIPHALAKFGQVDSDLNRKYEGTGLGLPLTKAFVELHGGTLDLQSAAGIGTTATVRFTPERVAAPLSTQPVRDSLAG